MSQIHPLANRFNFEGKIYMPSRHFIWDIFITLDYFPNPVLPV